MPTFLRYEKKFLINKEQHDKLLELLNGKIACDEHSNNGFYKVYTIYFDTFDNTNIRNSVERPIFKEKLRIRSYKHCDGNENVYLEVKKKYDGYGQKRRVKVSFNKALEFIKSGTKPVIPSIDEPTDYLNNQIIEEMSCFLKNNKVRPFVYVESCREAYYFIDDKETRITFDHNINYRYDNLDFIERTNNGVLLDNDTYVCEIKFKGAIPYELTQILSSLEIYRTHFSKVGKIYQKDNESITNYILGNLKGNKR